MHTKKTHNQSITLTGLGAGWSDAVRVDQLGHSGTLINIQARAPSGGPTGTVRLKVFRAKPPPMGMTNNATVPVALLDAANVVDDDTFLDISGITISPSATTASAKQNIAALGGQATYATVRSDYWLWASVQGITGDVIITLSAEGA